MDDYDSVIQSQSVCHGVAGLQSATGLNDDVSLNDLI